MEKKTLIISAFPGTGKSYCYNKLKDHYVVLDSDSSKFDKSKFPENYIKHIKDNIGKADIIFVSTHETVRNALIDAGIDFVLAFPRIECKDEYIQRYKERGNSDNFVKLLETNWEIWIKDMADSAAPNKLHMACGSHICEYIDLLLGMLDLVDNKEVKNEETIG